MRLNWHFGVILAVIFGTIALLYQNYPLLLFKVSEWQRGFNLTLSASLNSLQENSQQAGWVLVGVSFLYGIFHAVGPGHGKFVLSAYLSFEKTKLPQAVKLTLLSALVQGIVAILLVTIVVALLTLSRSYFNLTLQWIERGSFCVMLCFGLYWVYQACKHFYTAHKQVKIHRILHYSPQTYRLGSIPHHTHSHSEGCSCAHRHLPTERELITATDWRSQLMLILSIGLRPCSGAILVLFLAYTLNLYLWGIFSALIMALGTGITLTLFACLVWFFRQQAIKLGKSYLSLSYSDKITQWVKICIGLIMILSAILLLQSSVINSVSVFGR